MEVNMLHAIKAVVLGIGVLLAVSDFCILAFKLEGKSVYPAPHAIVWGVFYYLQGF
jgi:hypothetical protein